MKSKFTNFKKVIDIITPFLLFLILILLLIDTYTKSKENITVDNVVVKNQKKVVDLISLKDFIRSSK